MTKRSFSDVLNAALRDIQEHGYDSEERIEHWVDLLREAMSQKAATPSKDREKIRRAMNAIYRRIVERGSVLQQHEGVEKFTLQRIEPQLRAELDRRIMASANLIVLNRKKAIDDTLLRFRGWSTSIPAGGSKAVDKAEERDALKKSMASLPFRERRVLIDQGHKLVAAISEVVAKGGNAIAGRWHSHWRQVGYDYREDHRDRDEQVYLMRDSWALERGLIKPGKAGYYDEVTSVGEEPFCRCYMQWLYSLRDLPKDMLTEKGAAELKRVRIQG
jgi:hypothetical protein